MIDLKLDIPKEFLDEEERCGFHITKKQKEVWAVELDLLVELDRVCKKYNLKYCATGGTLLGAIRHKGFIPWDDDIDVMMLRDDYEKLCNVAPQEFKDPYFFQTEYSDPGSLRRHAQFRNSNTTGILSTEFPLRKPINQGIFLDIFPQDNVIDDELKYDEQKKDYINCYKFIYGKVEYINGHIMLRKNIFKYLYSVAKCIYYNNIRENGYIYNQVLEKYKDLEKICSRYDNMDTKYVCDLSFEFNKKHFKIKKGFENIEYRPFEFVEIPVPSTWNENLTIQYGDYMKMRKENSLHGGVIFDTSVSYKEYFEKHPERRKSIQ